jgi:hypothetical protein
LSLNYLSLACGGTITFCSPVEVYSAVAHDAWIEMVQLYQQEFL